MAGADYPENPLFTPEVSDRISGVSGRETGLANLSMEKALLGALLVDIREGVPQALDAKLKPEDFYKDAHGDIYSAILGLWDQNHKVDIFTVGEELAKRGLEAKCGGEAYLSELWDNSGVPAHVKDYAKSISEKSQVRQLMGICAEITEMCKRNPGEIQQILDLAESRIFALRDARDNGRMVYLPDAVHGVFNHVATLYGDGGNKGISGSPTGFSYLDYLTGGWQPSDLVILGGRPGMGKTSLALNFALAAALPFKRQTRADLPPYTVAIFSMEMSTDQLIQRLMCQLGGFDLLNIRSGRLTSEQMQFMPGVVANLMKASIFIDDSSGLTPLELRARTRRLLRKLSGTEYPLKLIIIDYLQLMNPNEKHNNLEQSVREISGALKALAKELNITVLALSQLKRPMDVSKPSLSDLRDSGAIEQDADIVGFVLRQSEATPDNPGEEGEATLTLRKHRNGPTGKVHLFFNKACSSFEPSGMVDVSE
ncbi:MAG: replicative DNA helicase [Deltaproteobacteria bacterium]|jgi:replicative DNA helicase|nr:replicative DNA helicase [Deltaproteobacteria bacterium]